MSSAKAKSQSQPDAVEWVEVDEYAVEVAEVCDWNAFTVADLILNLCSECNFHRLRKRLAPILEEFLEDFDDGDP